jgi:hypothetical protein
MYTNYEGNNVDLRGSGDDDGDVVIYDDGDDIRSGWSHREAIPVEPPS